MSTGLSSNVYFGNYWCTAFTWHSWFAWWYWMLFLNYLVCLESMNTAGIIDRALVWAWQIAPEFTSKYIFCDSMSLNRMYHAVSLLVILPDNYLYNRHIEWGKRKAPQHNDKWINKLPLCPLTGMKIKFFPLYFWLLPR